MSKLFWIGLQNLTNAITYIKRSPYLSGVDQPNEIKTYDGKSYLFAARIHRPAITSKSPLPVIIRVHGGGFIMNNPAIDDPLARFIADEAKCIVVAIDYRKAPRNVYPAPYDDVVDQTLAIIHDPGLNIDKSKVILCGTSAGGNLVLSAAQDHRLKGSIFAIMAVTPIVDRVTPFKEKMATRPDPSVPDFLAGQYESMSGFYPGVPGVDMRDVKLSPAFFKDRNDLPAHIYINAAEHDLLGKEAEDMAEKLAQGQPKRLNATGWEAGTVKFTRYMGQKHAFEAFPEKDADAESVRQQAVKDMYRDIADWVRATIS